jgi:hypothetical protein
MADNSAGANPPAGGRGASSADPNPQAGAGQPVGNAGTDGGSSPYPQAGEEGTLSADQVREIKREAQALRKRLAEYEAAAQASDLAKLDEVERYKKLYEGAQQQNAAYEIELQQSRLYKEIAKHAPSLNLVDPDAAAMFLNSGGELDTDDKGNFTNVQALLEKLVSSKPYLVAQQGTSINRPNIPSSGGATNPSRSGIPAAPAAPQRTAAEVYKARQGLGNPNLWKK